MVRYFFENPLLSSRRLIILIAVVWIGLIGFYKPWKGNVIINDVISYYGYLPATFIHHDILLSFTKNDPPAYKKKFWPEKANNGNLVFKTTLGVAFLYAPFFFAGHIIAPFFNFPKDGFSEPYQICLLISCLVFLLIGFIYLRKLLLLFFSEKITVITMTSVFFGTNLLWYSSFDGLMSHGYLFSLTTIFIYFSVKWYEKPSLRIALIIGFLGGLITLIRPTMIFTFLVFFLYDVKNLADFKERISFLISNYKSLGIIILFAFLVISPQLVYWKYATGKWFFFSYVGERFYFSNPHIIEGLFGFRKGWLIYTPIMTFALLGIYSLRKYVASFFFPIVILIPILIYVFFSWWAWWYGGSFGLRAFVDYYGLLAIPMACFFKNVFESSKTIFKLFITLLIFIFSLLNIFQSWQFKNGFLHYDSMTKASYFSGFFATEYTNEWLAGLHEPDYARARAGLPEAYSKSEIESIRAKDIISLKGKNFLIVTCEITTTKSMNCSRNWIGSWEKFNLIPLGQNSYAIKTSEGKYVTADLARNNVLFGVSPQISDWEKFELTYLGDCMILLKACNNRYVTISNDSPFRLMANGETVSRAAKFRIFIN